MAASCSRDITSLTEMVALKLAHEKVVAARPPLRRLVSLFSGAGGMDYGFGAAGFATSVAVEMDAQCCKTLRANGIGPVIEKSIFDVTRDELLETSMGVGELDLIIGGPPCQPFSQAGYWATGDSRRLHDPRAKTLSAYMDVVEWLQPKAFVLENVKGLAYNGKDEGLRLLLKCVERINRKTGTQYKPVFTILNAADYGVPQLRERFFMVASRDGTEFEFPASRYRSHDEPETEATCGLPLYRTAWDSIGDLPGPTKNDDLAVAGRWARLLPSIPEGKNYLWHTDRNEGGRPLFGWRTRYWGFLLKLAKNRPSWTISAQPGPANGPFHWNNRRLSMRELARLQTFPDRVNVTGGRTAVQRQLGNAVPSLIAEVLGLEIRKQIFKENVSSESPSLLPRNRGNPPRQTRTSPVPAEYRRLEGKHLAHPGTGKGPGAQARAKVPKNERQVLEATP